MYENPIESFNQLNNDLIQNLRVIALKEYPAAGYAQSLHYQLTSEFADNLDLSLLDVLGEVDERNVGVEKSVVSLRSVDILPNPASTFFKIENSDLILRFTIYDISGNKIIEGSSQSNINTGNWVRGLYVFKAIQTNGEGFTKKILIHK